MSSTPPPTEEEDNGFDQRLNEVVYDILQSDEFIDFISSLAMSSIASTIQYADDEDYLYTTSNYDLTWPAMTTLYIGDGEEEEAKEEIEWNITRYDGEEDEECSVCLIDFEQGDNVIRLQCKHIFHEQCIMEWSMHKAECPNCREKIKN
jgi:hypothetical protein